MRRAGILVCLLAVAALAAGCGGSAKPKPTSNGEAAKTASQIYADTKRAAAAASSVHAVGESGSGGGRDSFEVSIRRQGDAYGKFHLAGGTVEAIVHGSTIDLNGDLAFWQSVGDKGLPLKRITDHWVEAAASDAPAVLTSLLSWPGFLSNLDVQETLVKKGVTKFHGRQAIALYDATQNGTLYVSATGKPYLLGTVSGAVTITFDWNEPVTIPGPPKNVKVTLGH